MVLLRPEHSIVFLTGFMGSGKSTTGAYLAETLGLKFFDLDVEIETRMAKPIAQIIEDDGYPFFRKLEYEILKELAQQKFALIALGGGTITQDDNLDLVKENGVLVCLSADIKELWRRISESEKRNLIVGDKLITEEQIYERIELLMELRKPFYEMADVFVDTTVKPVEQIVQEIVTQLEILWYKKG